MRVGVFLRRPSVCRPPGMADSESALHRVRADHFLEVSQFARGPSDVQAIAAIDNRNAGGVVPAILQTPQPVKNDGYSLPPPDITDNSAHSSTIVRFPDFRPST